MARNAAAKWLGSVVLVIAMLVIHGGLRADQIEIDGDRLSVQAIRTPMRELLRQLSINYGITVRMDPDINPVITIAFQNRALEDGLKAMLKPLNHVLIWKNDAKTSDGANANYRLSEIHIFKPGLKDRMVTIDDSGQPQESESKESAPPAEPEAEPETSPDSLPQTRVIIKDNKVFVPVTLGYENNETETMLVFDTGAGSIVLHENVARQLGIEESRASQGEGVGGVKITTRTARLNYVQVGPHKKENLRVDIVAYDGAADADYNGLLGMNFIRGLKYTIDFDEQVITWNP